MQEGAEQTCLAKEEAGVAPYAHYTLTPAIEESSPTGRLGLLFTQNVTL